MSTLLCDLLSYYVDLCHNLELFILIERIKELCKAGNLSLSALEIASGINRGSIWRWDSNAPSIDKVVKVAEYFGCSIDYLLGRTDVFDIQLSSSDRESLSHYMEQLIDTEVQKRLAHREAQMDISTHEDIGSHAYVASGGKINPENYPHIDELGKLVDKAIKRGEIKDEQERK